MAIEMGKLVTHRMLAGCDVKVGRVRDFVPAMAEDALADCPALNVVVPAQPEKGISEAITVTVPLADEALASGSNSLVIDRVIDALGRTVLPYRLNLREGEAA